MTCHGDTAAAAAAAEIAACFTFLSPFSSPSFSNDELLSMRVQESYVAVIYFSFAVQPLIHGALASDSDLSSRKLA